MPLTIPTKQLELMLAGWRDSNASGFVASFFVHPEDEEYFKGATARKGKIAGQRYACVFVELGDDEQPVKEPAKVIEPDRQPANPVGAKPDNAQENRQEQPAKEPARRGKKAHFPDGLCGLAVRWCEDPHFQAWIANQFPDDTPHIAMTNASESAAYTLKSVLEIESRKEIDSDPVVTKTFKEFIMHPYAEARKEAGMDRENF